PSRRPNPRLHGGISGQLAREPSYTTGEASRCGRTSRRVIIARTQPRRYGFTSSGSRTKASLSSAGAESTGTAWAAKINGTGNRDVLRLVSCISVPERPPEAEG